MINCILHLFNYTIAVYSALDDELFETEMRLRLFNKKRCDDRR
jgi:hypothetical protein